MSHDLNYNVMFSQRGVMNLAHNLQDIRDLKRRTHANRLNNIDAVCVNFRCCSGELNLKYSSYHSGKTDDLDFLINHILQKEIYQEIVLVGFSLGANLLLKYLGERDVLPKEIKKGVLEQFIAVCKNIHICLVNNGSTDGTLEAINSISEKFIDRLSVVSIRNKKEDESALKLGFRFLMNNASVSKVILSNKLNMNELQNISEISSTLNSN